MEYVFLLKHIHMFEGVLSEVDECESHNMEESENERQRARQNEQSFEYIRTTRRYVLIRKSSSHSFCIYIFIIHTCICLCVQTNTQIYKYIYMHRNAYTAARITYFPDIYAFIHICISIDIHMHTQIHLCTRTMHRTVRIRNCRSHFSRIYLFSFTCKYDMNE